MDDVQVFNVFYFRTKNKIGSSTIIISKQIQSLYWQNDIKQFSGICSGTYSFSPIVKTHIYVLSPYKFNNVSL